MTDQPSSSSDAASRGPIQPATGTRDFYPIELARRRWIEDKWRTTAIRHGFEEIDGPTFEPTDLYTRKSGDGIVSEIFGVYSGKDEARVKQMGQRLAAGDAGAIAPYALRPEFTPTLARMFAARAGQLPKPTKWFWQQNCYRAEKPQRGRLREFMQWNCDIIGGVPKPETASGATGAAALLEQMTQRASENAELDAEVIACCVELLQRCGLTSSNMKVRFNDRSVLGAIVGRLGVDAEHHAAAFALIDRRGKLEDADLEAMAFEFGIHSTEFIQFLKRPRSDDDLGTALETLPVENREDAARLLAPLSGLKELLSRAGCAEWCTVDMNIARGLAYYTGMVFEVIVDGERAVAGGGRYDNLIETFGGPPTPAVGFGMGDVVLSLILQDKGRMPSDKQIAADLKLRPDAFVISNGTTESDALVPVLLARLRRDGLHARRSYKSTGKISKLLKEASDTHSRYAIIVESETEITLKDMDANTQDRGPREELLGRIKPA
jgi:histidyl-tRNA synthetase